MIPTVEISISNSWLLPATGQPPTVLVLNVCNTLSGADVFLPAVPVVIAMADSISDLAAAMFAKQFYAALGSAQSVGAAIRQGVVALKMADSEDADLPQHVSRDGVDVDALLLVTP